MTKARWDGEEPPGFATHLPDRNYGERDARILVPYAVKEALLEELKQRKRQQEEQEARVQAESAKDEGGTRSKLFKYRAAVANFEGFDNEEGIIAAFEQRDPPIGEYSAYRVLTGAELVRAAKVSLAARDDDHRKHECDLFEKLFELGPYRVVANPARDPGAWRQSLAELREGFPHFQEVTAFVENRVYLSQVSGKPLTIPAIHLTGDPGVGKTRYANELARRLGKPIRVHSMENAQAAAALLGTERHWSTACPGMVFDEIVLGRRADPMFMIEELDKAAVGGNCNPAAPLHSLLEPTTAANACDAFLGIHFDARLATFIATSNDRSKVPESLLSRFREFVILAPTGEQALQLARVVVRSVIAEAGVPGFAMPHDAWSHKIAHLTPREIGHFVHQAVARAVRGDRRHLTAADLPADGTDAGAEGRKLH
ncbi:AAA family ATPase [Variovorax sp. J22R133]|uniref:AAA family ATPase n=1 Tax=Variovorax brevis TaxID=3053503 RepID=UPI00257572BB|nr:AAA family ATPase [Variovorax sp. J22R133]MDM0116221.1 AAA family ATPase [Variovorax sp. J22R133]